MQILPPTTLPKQPPVSLEVRQSWRRSFMVGLVCAMVAVTALLTPYIHYSWEERPLMATLAGWWIGLWLGLFAWVFLGASRKARGPCGWVLRIVGSELHLHLRSYLNADFPREDATVLVLTRGDVVGVRAVEASGWRSQAEGGQLQERPWRRRSLEIVLAGPVEPLQQALQAEAQRRVPGVLGSRVRSTHRPLRLKPDGVLCLPWSDESNALTPALREVLPLLALRFPLLAAETRAESPLVQATKQEREDRLLELALRGEQVEAVKLAKTLYGMDTTRAVQFIQELQGEAGGNRNRLRE